MADHSKYPIFKNIREHNGSLVITSPIQNRLNCFRFFCFHEFEKGSPSVSVIKDKICECGHQDGHHGIDGCDGLITHTSITGRKRLSHCGCIIRYSEF